MIGVSFHLSQARLRLRNALSWESVLTGARFNFIFQISRLLWGICSSTHQLNPLEVKRHR